MKQIVKKFGGVLEYSAYLAKAKTSDSFSCRTLSSQRIARGWSEISFEEADKMLRLGDKVNAERISKQVDKVSRLKGSGSTQRTKQFNDVVGHAVHVPNFLVGIPQTMINSRKVRFKSSKVLNIVYNHSFHDGTDLGAVIDAGAKVLTYIKDLEAKGYRVNLWSMMCSKGKSETITALVRIKDSEQYLNITKTAYPIVNPDFLRRQFVRLIECETTDKQFTQTYGKVVYCRSDVEETLKSLRFKVDKYLTFYEVQRNGIER